LQQSTRRALLRGLCDLTQTEVDTFDGLLSETAEFDSR
jgi:hypothetical protein